MPLDPSATADASHSLILGAYARLPVEMLEPFARSLRATGFQGRFHVLVAGYDATALRQLGELADHVQPVDDQYDRVPPRASTALGYARRQRGLRRFYTSLFTAVVRAASERASLDRWRNLEFHLEGLQSLRYEHYLRYLMEDAPEADVVMITDLRDVVFQRDPFADPVTGLEVYLEDSSEQIGHDGFNTTWLRNLYGSEFVEARRGQPLSCSGVVIGTRTAMMTYLNEMATGIVWRRRPMGSHDQAVHNGLLHTGRLRSAKVVPNEHGRVLTLGGMTALPMSDGGDLLNADGTIPAVIHQWDRHPELITRLRVLQDAV
jgi:hypothetical protein